MLALSFSLKARAGPESALKIHVNQSINQSKINSKINIGRLFSALNKLELLLDLVTIIKEDHHF